MLHKASVRRALRKQMGVRASLPISRRNSGLQLTLQSGWNTWCVLAAADFPVMGYEERVGITKGYSNILIAFSQVISKYQLNDDPWDEMAARSWEKHLGVVSWDGGLTSTAKSSLKPAPVILHLYSSQLADREQAALAWRVFLGGAVVCDSAELLESTPSQPWWAESISMMFWAGA